MAFPSEIVYYMFWWHMRRRSLFTLVVGSLLPLVLLGPNVSRNVVDFGKEIASAAFPNAREFFRLVQRGALNAFGQPLALR